MAVTLSASMLTSCRCSKEAIQTETVRIEKEIVHDTIFTSAADSSSFRATLGCDSVGNVYIINSYASTGRNLKAPEVTIRDNILTADCSKEAEKLFFQWKSKFQSEQTTKVKTVEVERELTGWQSFQIWLGRFLILLVLIAVGTLIWIIWRRLPPDN